jgi:hypothetical protein
MLQFLTSWPVRMINKKCLFSFFSSFFRYDHGNIFDVKWFFVQWREKQDDMHAILFPPFKCAPSFRCFSTRHFFSFLLPQRHPLLTFLFSLINDFFFSVLLRQRRKNIQNERKTDELFSLFYFSYVFFLLSLIYLFRIFTTLIHTHPRTQTK